MTTRVFDPKKDLLHLIKLANEASDTEIYELGERYVSYLTSVDSNASLSNTFNPEYLVPKTVELIIQKMLYSNPRDRYQCCSTLISDLQYCLDQYHLTGQIPVRFPAQDEQLRSIEFSDLVYGRDAEQALLQKIHHESVTVHSQFIFVSGYSGIGKTALVSSVFTPKSYEYIFLEGKYDQYTNIPYVAIKNCLLEFITHPRSAELCWDQPNGAVLLDFVPELESIIGPQNDLPKLDPEQTKHRFQNTLNQLMIKIRSLCGSLVLFVDDMQWVDEASLELFSQFYHHAETGLLIIGAYRSNECPEGHRLHRFKESLQNESLSEIELPSLKRPEMQAQILDCFVQNTPLQELTLKGLDLEDIKEQVQDLMNCPHDQSKELATILVDKTDGNPFFLRQQLMAYIEKGLIVFDSHSATWKWDFEQLKADKVSENVASVISDRVETLPEPAQRIMATAAFLGNTFDMEQLTCVLADSDLTSIQLYLRLAEQKKLITPKKEGKNGFIFLHDQIQKACYRLTKNDKQSHEEIAWALHDYFLLEGKLESHLFQVVNHLNQGHLTEKRKVLELNIQAGKMAIDDTAYLEALGYFKMAEKLHGKLSSADPSLDYDIYYYLGECLLLLKEFDQAEEAWMGLLERTEGTYDRVRVYSKLVLLQDCAGDSKRGIWLGNQGLNEIGLDLNSKTSTLSSLLRYFWVLYKFRKFNVEHSKQASQETVTELYLIQNIIQIAYKTDQKLMLKLIIYMSFISLKKGTSEFTPFAFTTLGFITSFHLQSHRKGLEISKIGIELNESLKGTKYYGKAMTVFCLFAAHFIFDNQTSLKKVTAAENICLDLGDLYYNGACSVNRATQTFYASHSLQKAHDDLLEFMKLPNHINTTHLFAGFIGNEVITLLKNPSGSSSNILSQSRKKLDQYFVEIKPTHDYNMLSACQRHKFLIDYLFDIPIDSWDLDSIYHYSRYVKGLIDYPNIMTLYSLCLLRSGFYNLRKVHLLFRVFKILRELKIWQQINPSTFKSKYFLLKAELYRFFKLTFFSKRFYDISIQAGIENNFMREAGIANECAANFHQNRKDIPSALTYLSNAKDCYQKWGALAKVSHLNQKIADLEKDLV